jgi:hypothetical protein
MLGFDGSIMTVHVEVSNEQLHWNQPSADYPKEPYRRLGLAKALACKLMGQHLPDYGDDGWGAADVFIGNYKSEALCRSIGGRRAWIDSW